MRVNEHVPGPSDMMAEAPAASWRRRVVERSLGDATRQSLDRSGELILAAGILLEQTQGDDFTVQAVADMAKQSLRTLYVHFSGKDDLLLAVFEEAMHAFARLVVEAIQGFEDPLERLAAAIYFAARFPERATKGVQIGLAKLQNKLARVAPGQLASAQAPITQLFSDLVQQAAEAGVIRAPGPEPVTYTILTLLHSVGQSRTLGNEYELELPTVVNLVEFLLSGMSATLPDGWLDRFEERWDSMRSTFSVAEDFEVGQAGTDPEPS